MKDDILMTSLVVVAGLGDFVGVLSSLQRKHHCIQQEIRTDTRRSTRTETYLYQKRKAAQRLDSAMDAIYDFLKNGGVSAASIYELKMKAKNDQCAVAIQRAENYMLCFSRDEEKFFRVLTAAWEALCHEIGLRNVRLYRMRRLLLLDGVFSLELLRKTQADCERLGEMSACSQRGLYRIRMLQARVERRKRKKDLESRKWPRVLVRADGPLALAA